MELTMYNNERSLTIILEKILKKSKKYNTIDRFIYFKIEEKKLESIINSTDLHGYWIEPYKYEFLTRFNYIIDSLKNDIKNSFGLLTFEAYSRTKKTTIIDNPFLLGITPFLFNEREWHKYLRNDILKSSFTSSYHIESIILTSLSDTLDRLELKKFIVSDHANKSKTYYSADALFSLVVDDIFEMIENSDPENFKTIYLDKIETQGQIDKIKLGGNFNTGKLIEKIIEGFGLKNIKLSSDETKDIRNFVSQNFTNTAGRCLVGSEIKNKLFLFNNIQLIKSILRTNSKAIRLNNIEISKLLYNTMPEFVQLKTIENY